jgi:hypothetical protein
LAAKPALSRPPSPRNRQFGVGIEEMLASGYHSQVRQKTKRTGSGKPEPMRLEQGLLPCQFIVR